MADQSLCIQQAERAVVPQPIWTPKNVKATAIYAFRLYVNQTYSLSLRNYHELHEWSVTDIPSFAEAVFNFVGMKTSSPHLRIVDGIERMYPPPKWFPGSKMNYAENILCGGLGIKPNGVAVTVCSEGASRSEDFTFVQLEQQTAVWAKCAKKIGGSGSAIELQIDCLLILLAASSIGAVFSSTSPDIGATGIVERYRQIRPKVLICDTIIIYAAKKLDLCKKLSEANDQLVNLVPELSHTLVLNGPVFPGKNVRSGKAVLDPSLSLDLSYEQLPFDHPVYILFSSGTTGTPKCITHAAGRVLLQQRKELVLGSNVGISSTYYQYTTTGWMMWNWVVAAISIGARIVLYDGSPLHPTAISQLDIIRKQRVTHWGTSPKFLAALRQQGLPADLDVGGLQQVTSAGSPLSAEIYHWFASSFPAGIPLSSGSGGTDIVGGIVSGSPITEIYPGEISVPNLGMKVEIWDSSGTNIENTGEKGDLVITKPFFSMPVGFWGENGEAKYRAAYFEQFPGIWYHGDLIRKIPGTNGYEILGRSDGVLNPGGVRFGSAEIYGVLDRFADVQDCLCVGQKLPPDFHDEQVLLFLKMAVGRQLDDGLRARIRGTISRLLSPRHVPAQIFRVADIPYTANGKRIENLVRDVVAGKDVGEARTAINPECLKEYSRFVLHSKVLSPNKL